MPENKDKIICLVGESGSGKTTIAELLEKEGYNYIESYTTRHKRYEGERGHIFVWEMAYTMTPKEEMIAYTHFNNHHYWAIKDQYQGKGTSIYVIDVPGVKTLKEKVKDAEIIVIFFKADKMERFNRMKKDRGQQKAVDRINHDEGKFDIVKCDYFVNADKSIDDVFSLVKNIIKELNI